jgi:hypothetical protein
MEKKKKKNALGWWQKLNAGDPEKNIEIFNNMMTDHPNISPESSGTSSEAAMAEAIESIRQNPETNLEAIKALNLMDEEFYKPWLLDQKYNKHVLGKEGDRWAYFKNKKWSKEDYEKKAEELQEIPVDNKNVFGYKNEDGSISKYFQNTPEKYYVVYRIVDGVKKTITFYSLINSFEYLKKKGEDATKYGLNQRDLELGEALRLL